MGENLRDTATSGRPPALFLVELRATAAVSADVNGMHQALRHAAARLSSTGVAIRWRNAVLVPEDSRCLCFVEAADEADVARARDIAGLVSATVRQVHRLTDRASRDRDPPAG